MGISQLLPLLSESTKSCHVSEFRGQTVAVDSYCWLHKGARSCAMELAQGSETTLYVQYCMRMVRMLQSYDIKPIMVFDGRRLPAKENTEDKRRESRKSAYKQGMEYLRLGKKADAYKYFAQCVDITHKMALNLIQECRKSGVDSIVAPYEADAQLAFFNLNKVASVVITEDSDLLLFGCDKVLFKMDLQGAGVLVESDKIYHSMEMKLGKYTFEKFQHMCILSGCDYLASLPGIGLKKALKFIKLTAETNPLVFLDKLPSYLNMRQLTITPEYKEQYLTALATFKYQIVFNPFLRELVRLNDLTDENDLKYCSKAGTILDKNDAYQLALGNLDPKTMEVVDNWDPQTNNVSRHSIWSEHFTPYVPKRSQVSRPIKCVSNPTHDLETMQKLNEDQFEKDMEFYKKRPPTPFYPPEEVSQKSDNEMSPVLTNNPFVTKKISKFPTTEFSDPAEGVVASRHFFPHFMEIRESAKSFSTASSIDSDPSDLNDNLMELEDPMSICTSVMSSEEKEDEEPIEEMDKVELDKILDDVLKDETDWSECSSSSAKFSTEIKGKKSPVKIEKSNLENLLNVPNQGLKRKASDESTYQKRSKKQPTLDSMFANMRKKTNSQD